MNEKLHGVNISIFIRFMILFRSVNVMISPSSCTTCENEDSDISGSICNVCNDKSADIFQVEGEYCLDCWQRRTYPNL